MVMKMVLIAGAVLVVLLGGGAYYIYYINSTISPNSVTIDISIVGTSAVNATDTYSPDNFTVKLGQHVTLAVIDTDDNTHGLVISEFSVDTGKIPSGTTTRVTFVVDKTGIFKFYEPPGYCTGGAGNSCNSIQQMTGYMTVEP
jgi:plastocyanin